MNETELLAALEEVLRSINSMKVEAETAGAGGDEQMLQEACEVISNEGLAASMAIDAALALAAPAQDTRQPLTDAQIIAGAKADWVDEFKDFQCGVKFAEHHHGIK